MSKTVINLGGDDVELAFYLNANERDFKQSVTQCRDDSRVIGVIGEIAATRFLRGMYGTKRTVIPMGLSAREGAGLKAYGMGDIITILNGGSAQKKEVRSFEVKSRTAGKGQGNIIPCDSAEKYLDQGVTRVVFVDVELHELGATCTIAGYHQPDDIVEWDVVTNGMGQECYIMPVI